LALGQLEKDERDAKRYLTSTSEILQGEIMNGDLILMERLEPRENKDILVVRLCLGLCVYFGVTAGVDARAAIEEFIANPPHASPKDVKEGCGYCSIQ
jgi:hypothetical protein